MTTEELMIPRVKVVADYPGNQWEIGMILVEQPDGEMYCKENGFVQSKYILTKANTDKYPAIFQSLHWSDYRDVKDMPGYLKLNTYVFRMRPKDYLNRKHMKWLFGVKTIDYFLPATREEYEAYKKQQS